MYESLRSSFLLELEPFRIGGIYLFLRFRSRSPLLTSLEAFPGARVTQQSRSSASTSTRTNQDSPVTSVSSATEHKDSSSLHISGLRSPSDLAQAFTKELNTPSAEPATYQPSASPPLSPQTDAAMLEIIESETGMTPIPDQLSASVSSNEEDENVGSQPFHKPPMIVPTLKIEDVDELFRQPSENHSDRWQHHDKPNVDDSGFAIKSEDSDSGYQEAVNRLSSVQQRVRDMKAGQAYTTSISSSISQHSRTGTSKTAPLPFSTNPRLGSGLLSSELSHDRAPGWQRRMAGPKIHNLEGVAESLNIAGKPTPRRQSAPFIPGSPMPTLNKQTFASRAYGKAVSPKKESEEDDLPDGSQTPSGHR